MSTAGMTRYPDAPGVAVTIKEKRKMGFTNGPDESEQRTGEVKR